MAKAITNRPSVVITHTIPGKGVDFMEYDYHWHGKAPDRKQAKEALHELRTLRGKISHEGQGA
jgi:transketolase